MKSARGFLMLEGLLSAALVALFATTIAGLYITTKQLDVREIGNIQARIAAYGGLQEARAIRDANSAGFGSGVFGVATTSGSYIFSGTSDMYGGFMRTITVTEATTDTYRAVVNASDGVSTKSFTTYFTRWREALPLLASLELDTSNLDLYSSNRRIRDVFINNVSDDDITITAMDISWTGGAALNSLTQIRLDNSTVWSGVALSPVSANTSDRVVSAGNDRELELRFSSSIQGATVTLTLFTDSGDYEFTFQAVE